MGKVTRDIINMEGPRFTHEKIKRGWRRRETKNRPTSHGNLGGRVFSQRSSRDETALPRLNKQMKLIWRRLSSMLSVQFSCTVSDLVLAVPSNDLISIAFSACDKYINISSHHPNSPLKSNITVNLIPSRGLILYNYSLVPSPTANRQRCRVIATVLASLLARPD